MELTDILIKQRIQYMVEHGGLYPFAKPSRFIRYSIVALVVSNVLIAAVSAAHLVVAYS